MCELAHCGDAPRLAPEVVQGHIADVLPDEQASPEQIAALRAMTGQHRLKLAEQLYWTARKIKAAGVRCQHPTWSCEQVIAEVNRLFLNARG